MMQRHAAFSLVELSIVLVILGLLVGGILSGQSLIRAAQLRAITTEHQRYYTAIRAFKDKYFAIPGDMNNATGFWGKDNSACSGDTGTAATPGTCNGNGDSMIAAPIVPSGTGEMFQFWKQLALANLIEGSYSGLAGSSITQCVIGTNTPASRLPNSTWLWQTAGPINSYYPGSATLYANDYGNALAFGANSPSSGPSNPNMTPSEAWNLDTKLDDGKPATGSIITRYWGTCTTASSATDFASPYNLADSTNQCALIFVRQF